MMSFWVAIHPSKQPIWVQYFCIHESVKSLFLFCFLKKFFSIWSQVSQTKLCSSCKTLLKKYPRREIYQGGIYLEFWDWTPFYCLLFCLLSKTYFLFITVDTLFFLVPQMWEVQVFATFTHSISCSFVWSCFLISNI